MEDINEEKLKTSMFFVEATSCEQQYLWAENHEKLEWVQDNMGFWQIVGYINKDNDMPVCVSFSFVTILGKRICFYDVTSRFSDSKMVENFIEKNYNVKWDSGRRLAMTDAANFHLAIDAVKNN